MKADPDHSAPRYSIVVPAYNEAAELPETLAALRAAVGAVPGRGEIIVVDNNSSDETAQVAATHGADQVVFEPVNQIARARNAGAAFSRAPFLIFVDADTCIPAELLAESLRQLESGRCVGGGSVIQFEGEINRVGRCAIGLWKRVSRLTHTAAGSYLFCRADAFAAVGGFDQKLYASEEVRLSRLLRKWGKPRGLCFPILTEPPARTSARKLQWYSTPQMLGWIFFMLLFPLAVRWRRLCGFWYRRPEVHP